MSKPRSSLPLTRLTGCGVRRRATSSTSATLVHTPSITTTSPSSMTGTTQAKSAKTFDTQHPFYYFTYALPSIAKLSLCPRCILGGDGNRFKGDIRALQQQNRHTSHVTRHTPHATRHTSHVTRHTSHVTRHTSLERSNAAPSSPGWRHRPIEKPHRWLQYILEV